ncbi:hypothetical protein GCM10011338_28700 [Alteromonas lipolytica]|nr:hypothetical protein GCM10011338_28700 [Alteromonas lipolytica]
MRRQFTLLTLLFSSMTMLGCVSQPQSVKANLPLVNPSFANHNDASSSSLLKSKAKAIPELRVVPNQTIIIEGEEYTVSAGYTSALGNECYRLHRTGNSGAIEVRPVCNNKTFWLLYPTLVSNNTL